MPKSLLACLLFTLTDVTSYPADSVIPGVCRENLVAWCIVPFDAKKRGPEARAKMLVDLGLKRSAYDWRSQYVSEFEEEILQYKKHGIEFFAFWNAHPDAFKLFKNMASNLKSGARSNLPNQATRNLRLMRQQNL